MIIGGFKGFGFPGTVSLCLPVCSKWKPPLKTDRQINPVLLDVRLHSLRTPDVTRFEPVTLDASLKSLSLPSGNGQPQTAVH